MPPPWTDPHWRAEAERWIREHGEVTGEIEQPHVRPWSTVMRVPTAAGDLWFKAVSPLHRFEPALTGFLAELRPDRVPEVVALDHDRAWMLLRDGGTRLRELPATAEHWAHLLPVYAELQIAAAPHAGELLELGVPDFRLANLRDLLEDLLSEQPEGLTSDEYRAMLDRLPEVESIADRLLAHGIPETIQHDDLHDGQVFVRDGRYLIFDWGDSCVSHPFHTLTVTLRGGVEAWARARRGRRPPPARRVPGAVRFARRARHGRRRRLPHRDACPGTRLAPLPRRRPDRRRGGRGSSRLRHQAVPRGRPDRDLGVAFGFAPGERTQHAPHRPPR
jgi:hypothetical protein